MKRNMELVRKILELIEENGKMAQVKYTLSGYEPLEVHYHTNMLIEGGYLKGRVMEDGTPPSIGPITWAGYELLDKLRSADFKGHDIL